MKITFLGTSHGVPAADRYCSCTMLEVGGSVYFIDAGAPLIDLLIRRGTPLESIRALFTTHLHGDHVNGVLPFADLLNWYFTSTKVKMFLTEQDGVSLFPKVVELTEGMKMDEQRLTFHLETPGVFYEDENLRVTAIPTQHIAYANRPSYALLIEAEGKKVLFTGDLSHELKRQDFPACAMEEALDLVVMEMAHFEPEQAKPYLDKCLAKQLCVQHVYPLEKYERIREMAADLPYPVLLPEDGDELEL